MYPSRALAYVEKLKKKQEPKAILAHFARSAYVIPLSNTVTRV